MKLIDFYRFCVTFSRHTSARLYSPRCATTRLFSPRRTSPRIIAPRLCAPQRIATFHLSIFLRASTLLDATQLISPHRNVARLFSSQHDSTQFSLRRR